MRHHSSHYVCRVFYKFCVFGGCSPPIFCFSSSSLCAQLLTLMLRRHKHAQTTDYQEITPQDRIELGPKCYDCAAGTMDVIDHSHGGVGLPPNTRRYDPRS